MPGNVALGIESSGAADLYDRIAARGPDGHNTNSDVQTQGWHVLAALEQQRCFAELQADVEPREIRPLR